MNKTKCVFHKLANLLFFSRVVFVFLCTICFYSSYSQNVGRYVGADMVLEAADPNDAKKVRVTITYYRRCEPNRINEISPNTIGVTFSSSSCCARFFDTISYNPVLSDTSYDEYSTPICMDRVLPGVLLSRCNVGNETSATEAFRKEVYQGVVTLPTYCNDWLVSHTIVNIMPSNIWGQAGATSTPVGVTQAEVLTRQNFLISPSLQSQERLFPNNNPPPPTTLQTIFNNQNSAIDYFLLFGSRPNDYLNLENYTIAPQISRINQSPTYLEAWYSNKEERKKKGLKFYVANNLPKNAIDMHQVQCVGSTVTHDFGFYDPDEDSISFSFSAPFIDIKTPGGLLPRFTENGIKLTFRTNPGGFSESNPMGPTGTASIDPISGRITINANQVGFFKFGIKIDEFDRITKQKKGVSYRDFTINIVGPLECNNYANSMSAFGSFQGQVSGTGGRRDSYQGQEVFETCAGLDIELKTGAINNAPLPPYNTQVPQIVTYFVAPELAKDSLRMYYVSLPGLPRQTEGFFSMKVPNDILPGLYPIVFQINDCINNFQTGKYKVVFLRINEKIEAVLTTPTAFSNELINLYKDKWSSKRALVNCADNSCLKREGEAYSRLSTDSFSWRKIIGVNSYGERSSGLKNESLDLQFYCVRGPDDSVCFEVTNSQYCLNKDTICWVDDKSRITPRIQISIDTTEIFDNNFNKKLYDLCVGDKIKVDFFPNDTAKANIYSTKWLNNSQFSVRPRPFTTDEDRYRYEYELNTNSEKLNLFAISQGGCFHLYESPSIQTLGIRPKITLSTDRVNVCPNDPIQITGTPIIKGYTGFDVGGYAKKEQNAVAKIVNSIAGDVNASIAPTANIFNASPERRYMRTQVIYRAEELKCFLQPGIIESIGVRVRNVGNPSVYSNLQLKVSKTSQSDFDIGNDLIDLSTSRVARSESNVVLEKDKVIWLRFDVPFYWDGTDNLVFEFIDTCIGYGVLDATATRLYEERTPSPMMMGYYQEEFSENWDKQSGNLRSDYRPQLFVVYSNIDTNIIKYKWSPTVGLDNPEKLSPIVNYNKKTTYNLTAIYPANIDGQIVENCYFKDSIVAFYDDSFRVRVKKPQIDLDWRVRDTNVFKCTNDTLQLLSYASKPKQVSKKVEFRPYEILEACKPLDKTDTSRLFPSSNLSDSIRALVSPFSLGTGPTAHNARRIQYIIPKEELREFNSNLSQVMIKSIEFTVLSAGNTPNPLVNMRNFTIKMAKTSLNNFSRVPNTTSIGKFAEFGYCDDNVVYFKANQQTVIGKNRFDLNRPFGFNFDSTYNLLIEICWNNSTNEFYNQDIVLSGNIAGGRNRTITAVTRNRNFNICQDTVRGTLSSFRPIIKFEFCIPTEDLPPVPKKYQWIPTQEISNTLVPNPVVYNSESRTYVLMTEYRKDIFDSTLTIIGDELSCRVYDTINVQVYKPQFTFLPNPITTCQNKSTTVEVIPTDPNVGRYKFKWDIPQVGIAPEDSNQFLINVNPGMVSRYYTGVLSLIDSPNCWNRDSVQVLVDQPVVLPSFVQGVSKICPDGDSTEISVPIEAGYSNPRWFKQGLGQISNQFTIKVADTGRYYVEVDSGNCSHKSGFRDIEYHKIDTQLFSTTLLDLCEGDSALVSARLNSGLQVPQWNDGVLAVQRYIKEPGLYFVVNAKGDNGCKLYLRDSVRINRLINPPFGFQNDTICVGLENPITLVPDPLHTQARYRWYPNNVETSAYEVRSPGTYRVVRTLGTCTKEARVVVVPDSFGSIQLLPDNMKRIAVCCDEQIELNANPNNKKYIAYNWNNGDKSQILYTQKNTSALYFVESTKPSGCRDTGSVFIDNKCLESRARAEKDTIRLGETNRLIGDHLLTTNPNVTYKWFPYPANNKSPIDEELIGLAKPVDSGDAEYLFVVTSVDSSYSPPKICVENNVVRFRVLNNLVKIPNVFTPNGDGKNDTYYPQIDGVVNLLEFKIYNRFGQLIHNDPNTPWDGKFEGQEQPTGVYICLIQYRIDEHTKENNIHNIQINLTLLR